MEVSVPKRTQSGLARLRLWKSSITLVLTSLLVILALLPAVVNSAEIVLTDTSAGCPGEGMASEGQDPCEMFYSVDDADDDCCISGEVYLGDLWNMELDDEVLEPTMLTINKRAPPLTDSASMAASTTDPSESSATSAPDSTTSTASPSDTTSDAISDTSSISVTTLISLGSPIATTATNTSVPATTTSAGSASETGVDASTVPPSAPSDTSSPTTSTSSAAAPTETASKSASVVIPLAVGVSVGGTSLMLGVLVGAWFWRRRRHNSFATAESPPPRDIPDNLETVAINSAGNGGAGAGGGDGGLSRQGSVLSSLSQYPGYTNNRFGPDSVAMHDVPRAPSARPDQQWQNMQGPTRVPEIPYDGRRFPPYYGIPPVELPG